MIRSRLKLAHRLNFVKESLQPIVVDLDETSQEMSPSAFSAVVEKRNVPRYDALGLFCGRRAQVGDLSRLELRQRWLAT